MLAAPSPSNMPAWYLLQLDPWLKYSNSATDSELPGDSVAHLVRAWQAIWVRIPPLGSIPSLHFVHTTVQCTVKRCMHGAFYATFTFISFLTCWCNFGILSLLLYSLVPRPFLYVFVWVGERREGRKSLVNNSTPMRIHGISLMLNN